VEPVDSPRTVGAWIRRLAERFGERELLVQDARRLRYGEAEQASARLALGLLERGVGKGARVGILLPNGPDWVVAWLAATRIGAVAVPINTFFQARELGFVLRHADVELLLAADRFLSHDYLARLEQIAPALGAGARAPLRLRELPFLRRVAVFGEGARRWSEPAAALLSAPRDDEALRAVEAQVSPADPLVILYSSGSTADPKGAVHAHGAVIRHAHALGRVRGVKESDRVWSPMPFFWVGGLVFALLGNLQTGACTLCEEVFEPERTLRFLERERATIAIGWPHFGKALAEHPSRRERDLSALRGGNVPDLLPDEVCPADPELRANALGMTETCGPHTWGGQGRLPEDLRGSFGCALPGIEHKVVDPATGAALPAGQAGEICVRGYSLMLGLHKLERAQTFDPDGFYHTGDGGYFDARGVLYFQGRLGELIKSGGANVTPAEVEAALAAQPEIREAYVVGVPDPARGERVAAAVVLAEGARLDARALRARLRGELAAYKVPQLVHFAAPGTLPFTDSGKIDKRRLRALLAAAPTRGTEPAAGT
jgi:acyl-CoA synthetase (AMP-forming)/AMP-acid ligase II